MLNLVSIIIPVFNRQDYLPETLHSIAQQTYSNWQLVVIDDGSTDNSVELIEQFSNTHSGKVKLLHSASPQSGAATCRNIGIEEANGNFILFLDSDDKLAELCLEQRIKVMSENTTLDWAVFLQYLWKTDIASPYAIFNKPIANKEAAINYFFQMDPAWQTMAPIWKKSTLQKLTGFDVSLIYMEDPDLHLRALLDNSLNVSINYHLPADCYYRVDNMDDTKIAQFYELSIISRFSFLNKLPAFFENIQSKPLLKGYKAEVRKGYFNFFKGFVLARISNYKKISKESLDNLKSLEILSLYDIWKIKILISVFSNDSWLVTKLKIKGLLYKLIK